MLANAKRVVLSADEKEDICLEEIKTLCATLKELNPYNYLPHKIEGIIGYYMTASEKEKEELNNQGRE